MARIGIFMMRATSRTHYDGRKKYKTYIFLRDLLDMSITLDYNFADRLVYTELGKAESNAKTARHQPSIKVLAKACVRAISDVSYYKESDVICAVPPSPDKEWDLPAEIVALVSQQTGKRDISKAVRFTVPKKSIKAASLSDKWAVLEGGQLTVFPNVVKGRKVILIDDKYQSGMTAQFVASRLYEAGVEEVNGLFCIKTWRDTDNQ
ncbi:MAG TPA: hypothetical protein VMF86_09650 [Stellaceae bacterium]|nr:hypothetical protein [Stellaceae bacterium]